VLVMRKSASSADLIFKRAEAPEPAAPSAGLTWNDITVDDFLDVVGGVTAKLSARLAKLENTIKEQQRTIDALSDKARVVDLRSAFWPRGGRPVA
jgi:hypothetical protein